MTTDQEAILASVLAGCDVLVQLKTGAGKSLTFQLPAARSLGTTVVICPLVALMREQVSHLTALSVPAAFLSHDCRLVAIKVWR